MRLHALLLLLGSLAVQFKISYQTALPACDIKYIQGAKPAEFTYTNNELKCNHGNKIEHSAKPYASLRCRKGVGWTDGTGSPLKPPVKANANLDIKCVAANCQPTAQLLPTGQHDYAPTTRVLTCPGGEIRINDRTYAKLTCNNEGWTDGTNLLDPSAPTNKPLAFKCVKPCDASLVTGAISETSYANPILSCNENHKLLKYKDASGVEQEVRAPLTCDASGTWGTTDVQAASPLEIVGCVDPPACDENWINKNPAKVTYTPGAPSTLTCGPGEKLRVDDKMYAKLECDSTANEWKGEGARVKAANEKFDAACVTACKNIKGDLTSDAKEDPPGVFKCKKLGIGEDKNGIKLDGQFVGSHLHCNEQDGWHDVDKKKIADAFAEVDITCERLPCKESVRSTCANMGLSKVKLDDYYCDESSNGARWPVEDDDPNFLKCRSKKTMFEIDRLQKFLVKSPKCKNTDNKWLIYDDNNNNAIEEVKPNVLCIQKRCNMCSKLNNPDNSVVFTEGKVDECALAKCKNDLWKIKKEGASSREQYAGEVTCSSVKGKEGKWVIDGETPIEEGSCIPEATLAICTEASKLVTTCTTAWKADFGCVDIPLSDAEYKCPAGSLFYMQRVDSGFQEGASKIECDTAKGTWTITKGGGETVVLKRGGTIVCATSNPKPTTTTLAPTTTTKYENPCDVCYENNTTNHMFKCPTCSDKPSDVIATVAGDMCRATHHDKKDLVTEKAGSVKEIECSKSDKVWKTKDGKEVGKFAAFLSAEKETEGQMGLVVGGAIGGVVLLIIVFAVIFKVFIAKREPDSKEEETRRKKLEETRRKKQKAGDNDEILDGVSVDAPSELKL